MNISSGTKGIALIECINPYIKKYRLRWNVTPIESEESENQVQFFETDYVSKTKPRLQDVKTAILQAINQDTDNKILSGFIWNGMSVWLSSENQFNYKAAYDLTLQSGGQTLPVLFKFGTTDNPIYYTFNTIEELSNFYISAMKYISDTLAEGWAMKDSIDWSLYEAELKNLQ